MRFPAFAIYCAALPGARLVVQWGGAHVYKLGPKVFAIGQDGAVPHYVFKTTPLGFEILLGQGLAVRAPYLPRGHWVQVAAAALADGELKSYLKTSHGIIAAGLSKAMRGELAIAAPGR